MVTGQLSLLEQSKLETPLTTDEECIRGLAARLIEDFALCPPIDERIVASAMGIHSLQESPIPWAGCLLREDDKMVIKVRKSDGRGRQRFTAFHEIAHTFLPGYHLTAQFRCDPNPTVEKPAREENLCDIAAAEFLFPSRYVREDVADSEFDFQSIDRLRRRYDASLEAAAIQFVNQWPEDALLVVLETGRKPSERGTAAAPKLRVRYAHASGAWPYIPRHKSVSSGSRLAHVLDYDEVAGESDLDGLSNRLQVPVTVVARACPFVDHQGVVRERVLALYRKAGEWTTDH